MKNSTLFFVMVALISLVGELTKLEYTRAYAAILGCGIYLIIRAIERTKNKD